MLLVSTALVVSTLADDSDGGSDLKVLLLDKLAKQLDSARRADRQSERDGEPTYDAILCAFVGRGGDAARTVLMRRLKPASSPQDLELLTAVRRLEDRPDPLAIAVAHPEDLKAGTRNLPMLDVAIENVDPEERSVQFQFGGDNRSGRHDRWRIQVWDSRGRLLPEIPRWSSIGGGRSETRPLAFGEKWKARLRMGSYVNVRAPGKYKVQVLYHNAASIADISDPKILDGLILSQSEPFELNIEHGPKIPIHLEAGSTEKTRDLVKSLDERQKVLILLDDYDEEAHDFIDPKSPQGQLLAMKWQAVPGLLESLEDETLSFRKRAWIFALLISITRERDLDPMTRHGVLPAYAYRGSLERYWVTSDSGLSGTLGGNGSSSGGRENPDEQLRLTREWLQFRQDYLDIQAAR
jgi:hypothetical protein